MLNVQAKDTTNDEENYESLKTKKPAQNAQGLQKFIGSNYKIKNGLSLKPSVVILFSFLNRRLIQLKNRVSIKMVLAVKKLERIVSKGKN